jgi:translocator protein
MKNIYKFIISITVCQGAGIIGSLFTAGSINDWYIYLTKPSFTPPNWLFAPVWITLYTLIAISLYFIWSKRKEDKENVDSAITLFIIGLIFNINWSILFFGLHNSFYALLDIIFMWIITILLMRRYWQIEKWSFYLMIPYILWITLAGALNYFIWVLN